jgi:hypothetical protein
VSPGLLRRVLVLAGAYWLAEWFATMLMFGVSALGISYGGIGRLGELGIDVLHAAPRALAAAGGATLLWLTLGPAATRRWVWGLAGLFVASGVVDRYVRSAAGLFGDPVSHAMDQAVWTVLPALGCLAAVWLLGRVAPAAVADAEVPDPHGAPAGPPSRAILVVGAILTLLVGATIGTWIMSTVQVRQLSAATVAALDDARRSRYALTQYREADYEEAKRTLEQFAVYLEGQKPASSPWQPGQAPLSDEKGLAFDRMLTYGRLALRAERANRHDEAIAYWQRAEHQAQALRWEQPTRDRIRSTITGLDTERPGTRASPR